MKWLLISRKWENIKAPNGRADCQSKVTRLCLFPWTLGRLTFDALRTEAGASFQIIHKKAALIGETQIGVGWSFIGVNIVA